MSGVVDWSSGKKVLRAVDPSEVPPDDPIAVIARREKLGLTRVQAMLMLVEGGFISADEMKASQSAIPESLLLAASGEPAQVQTEITTRWLNFQHVYRNDTLVEFLAAIPDPNLTDVQLDALFEAYAAR